MRRKSYVPRSIGSPNQKVYFFKRHVNLPSLVAADPMSGSDSSRGYNFELSDVPNPNDFINLFDSYKILGVRINVLPVYTESNNDGTGIPGSGSSWGNLRIFTAIDYNDGSASSGVPTDSDTMRQYQNCKVTQFTRGHRRYFKPVVTFASSVDGGNMQTSWKDQPWVQTTTSANSPYCSLYLLADTTDLVSSSYATGDVLCRVEATYYMAFKQPR